MKSNSLEPMKVKGQNRMPKWRVLAYSIGHFYNDLCASMWFIYFLIYMEKVVKMPSWKAGILMNIGQITDALSTPLIGILSDHSTLPDFIINRFGRRKSWHIIGTFCVTISFALIFSDCLICQNNASSDLLFWWFVPTIMLFQFGWAAVQIAHLAMIPDLTDSEPIRMSMTSFRYGFTVLASVFVFAVLSLFLTSDSSQVGPEDQQTFQKLALIVVGIGTMVTLLFYAFVNEKKKFGQKINKFTEANNALQINDTAKIFWYDWFRYRHFYLVALLYLCSRVYINISFTYFTFYIESEQMQKIFLALLPLTAHLCSMAASVVIGLGPVSKRADGKPLFMVGAVLGFLNSAMVFFPITSLDLNLVLSTNAIFLGLAQALLLICSLKATATLISHNTESGAFVYGAMSFLDKLSNGLIVQLLEIIKPDDLLTEQKLPFYRGVMALVPGACVAIIFLILIGMDMSKIGVRKVQKLKLVEDKF